MCHCGYTTLHSRSLRSRRLIPDSHEEAQAGGASTRLSLASGAPLGSDWPQQSPTSHSPEGLSWGCRAPHPHQGVPIAPPEQMTPKWQWDPQLDLRAPWGGVCGKLGGVCGKLTQAAGWGWCFLVATRADRHLPPSLRVPAWPSGGRLGSPPTRGPSLHGQTALSHSVSRALWGGSRLNISLMAPCGGSHAPHDGPPRRESHSPRAAQPGGQLCSTQMTGLRKLRTGRWEADRSRGLSWKSPKAGGPGPSLEGQDILSLQDTPPSWPAGPLRPGLSS